MELIALALGSVAAAGTVAAARQSSRKCWEKSACIIRRENPAVCERCAVFLSRNDNPWLESRRALLRAPPRVATTHA